MTAIKLLNLSKQYDKKTVVDNLSLEINEGEFFALLGFNGAGKTVTIKMLSGLTIPSSGDAYIYDYSIKNDMDKIKSLINISPQETAIANNLTVSENLEFVARIYDYSKEDAKRKAIELMNKFSLTDRKDDKAKKLSGGFKRRLSIAMALISDPKILFLDEPTLGLDIRSRKDLWNILLNLKGKITIIMTTHYLEEVIALADKIAIIDKGQLKISGTLDHLKEQTKLENLEDILLSLTESKENI